MSTFNAIPGTTIVLEIQVKDRKTGAVLSSSGYSFDAKWITSTDVTPVPPTITNLDDTTWVLVADATGLDGRAATLRYVGFDPVTGYTVGEDWNVTVRR